MREFFGMLFNGIGTIIIDAFKTIIDVIVKIVEFIKTALAIFDARAMASLLDEPVKILIGNSGGYQGSPAYKVYEVMIPVGAAFLLIYLAMHITDLAVSGQFNTERFVKTLAYAIISVLIMDNGYEFMVKCYEAICDPTTGLIADIANSTGGGIGGAGNAFANSFNIAAGATGQGWLERLEAIQNILYIFPALVASLVFGIFVTFTVDWVKALRAIKIAILMAWAPIAFANIFGDGMVASRGFTHFKKILSLFLQAPIILITMHVITATVFANAGQFGAIMTGLIFCIAIKRALKHSEETAATYVGL